MNRRYVGFFMGEWFSNPQPNRPTQSLFVCQRCKHTENADTNAGKVLVKRGITQILSGDGVPKKKVKRVGITKQKVGVGCSKPAEAILQPTLVETAVNRRGGNTPAFVSLKRETPATAHA